MYLGGADEHFAIFAVIDCNGIDVVEKIDIAVFTVLYHKLLT